MTHPFVEGLAATASDLQAQATAAANDPDNQKVGLGVLIGIGASLAFLLAMKNRYEEAHAQALRDLHTKEVLRNFQFDAKKRIPGIYEPDAVWGPEQQRQYQDVLHVLAGKLPPKAAEAAAELVSHAREVEPDTIREDEVPTLVAPMAPFAARAAERIAQDDERYDGHRRDLLGGIVGAL